jgi:hypothetical protein
MSISDSIRLASLEAAIAELRGRTAALEDMVADTRAFCEARQVAETPAGGILCARCVSPTQRPPSAPVDGAVMADVIDALQAGQSIRRAADTLGLDRNKVARLRQRAITEGWLAVSPGRDMRAP